jgi:hypothetical protein
MEPCGTPEWLIFSSNRFCWISWVVYYFHSLNTQSMSDYIYLYQSLSLSPSSQSVCSSSSHSLLTSPSSSLPFHNISSSVPFTALDIQHLLKTLHSQFWWDVLPFHYDAHWLIHLYEYFLVFKLTWTQEQD